MTPNRIPSADGKTGKPTDSTRSSRIADLLTPEHKRNLDPGFAPTSLNLRLFGPALNVISLPLLLPVSPVPWSGALDWGEGGGVGVGIQPFRQRSMDPVATEDSPVCGTRGG
ncbi:hypothetical protein FKM82_031117 [Ascaphus truei]